MAVAERYGSAQLGVDEVADPRVAGVIEGTNYMITIFGCDDGSLCTDLYFYSSWSGLDISLEQVNEWNRTPRFAMAYLDEDEDPVTQMDVNLRHGVTVGTLDDSFDWWKLLLEEYTQEVLLN